MTEPLPDPLVPADVDLRDFAFMPLDVLRLRDSDLATLASGDEFKAAVLLWCASWHQIPAGSLPNDDRWLAKHSGAGARWKKVRDEALRGFTRCDDGRLYHAVVAEKALEAWDKKRAQRERTKAATDARERKRRDADARRDDARNDQRNVGRNDERDEQRNVVQGTGTGTGNRQGEGKSIVTESSSVTSPTVALATALRSAGLADASIMHPQVIAWAESGVTVEQVREAVRIAHEVRNTPKPKVGYLVGILNDLRNPKAAQPVAAANGKPWFIQSHSAIVAKGEEKGVREADYESTPDFRAAVLEAHGVTAEQVRKAELDYGVRA